MASDSPPAKPAARAAHAATLRPAVPSDAEAVARLLGSIGWFKAYAHTSAEQASAAVQALLTEAQASDRSLHLVALDGQAHHLIGYCAVHWLPLAILQGWEGYVSELFVADTARGSGAGSQLLDAAVQAARDRGCARIWLCNNRERPSYTRGFYTQQGWSEQPEIARFLLNLTPPAPASTPTPTPSSHQAP